MHRTGKKKILLSSLGVFLLIFGTTFFLLRGPYLSNQIKREIIPVLENVTRERITIKKAVINLFPFYFQVKRLNAFDKDGRKLLMIRKARVYINPLALLSKKIMINKITLKEPVITAKESDIERILDNISKSASIGEGGEFRVELKEIHLTNGTIDFADEEDSILLRGSGFFLELEKNRERSKVDLILEKAIMKFSQKSEINGRVNGKFRISDNKINIWEANIMSPRSFVKMNGHITLKDNNKIDTGSLDLMANIDIESIKDLLTLKEDRAGHLIFEGNLKLDGSGESGWPLMMLDLKTDSSLNLETLLGIIETEDYIKGKVELGGAGL